MDSNTGKGNKLPSRYWYILGIALLASTFLPFFYPPDKKSSTTVIGRPDLADKGFRTIWLIALLVVLSAVIYFVRQAFDETFPLRFLPGMTVLILVFILVGVNLKGGMEANASEQLFPGIVWFLGPLVLLSPIWITTLIILIKSRVGNADNKENSE